MGEALGGTCATGALAGMGQAIYAGRVDPAQALRDQPNFLNNTELIGGLFAALGSGGDVNATMTAARIARSGFQNNYLNHAEAAQRSDAKRRLAECEASGQCSASELVELRLTIERLNSLDDARDTYLKGVCSGGPPSPTCVAAMTDALIAMGVIDPPIFGDLGTAGNAMSYRKLGQYLTEIDEGLRPAPDAERLTALRETYVEYAQSIGIIQNLQPGVEIALTEFGDQMGREALINLALIGLDIGIPRFFGGGLGKYTLLDDGIGAMRPALPKGHYWVKDAKGNVGILDTNGRIVTSPADIEGVVTGASASNTALRLNNQLAAEQIAGGHGFSKHVLAQGEFAGLGIRTRQQYQHHIESVLNNPDSIRYTIDGRRFYLQESSGTIVIRNPNAIDGGTAFQPVDWRQFVSQLPTRTDPY